MAYPSSPLPCHPCYRLWSAEPLTWQDLIWGLHPTVCHEIRSANCRLIAYCIYFSDIFYKPHSLWVSLWRSPQAPTSQVCEASWICVCTLLPRSLRKWKLWLDSACLGLWDQAVLADLQVWSHWLFDFSHLFGIILTVDGMRHSRARAVELNSTWKPGSAMCRCDLGHDADFEELQVYIHKMRVMCLWYGAAKMASIKVVMHLTSVCRINTHLMIALIIKIIFMGSTPL